MRILILTLQIYFLLFKTCVSPFLFFLLMMDLGKGITST